MVMQRDPVGGMQFKDSTAPEKSDYLEQTYYFCSEVCHTNFDGEPEKYINQSELSEVGKCVSRLPLFI